MSKRTYRLDDLQSRLDAGSAHRLPPMSGGTPLAGEAHAVRPPPSFQDDAPVFPSEAGLSLPAQKIPSEKPNSSSADYIRLMSAGIGLMGGGGLADVGAREGGLSAESAGTVGERRFRPVRCGRCGGYHNVPGLACEPAAQ